MDIKDEYLVYIDEGKTHRYYKNKKLHREAGPAYVCTIDVEKYTNLSDEDLYKKVYEPVVPKIKGTQPLDINGEIFLIYSSPIKSTYYGSYYYLEGIKYSKEDFEKIMFKNNLEKELPQEEKVTSKRPKL